MKKSLVALATLAATGAMAQVTISGMFDVGYQSLDLKGNKVTQAAASNGTGTSSLVFGITEDLGGGLRFNGRWEVAPALSETGSRTAGTPAVGVTSNVTSFLGNGMSFVGVESQTMGQIRFGAINTVTLSANGDGNGGFSTAVGSGYRVSSFDAVRYQNSLAYNTPVINGFSAQYIMSAKNDKQSGGAATGNNVNQTSGRDAVTELGLTYANGPLTVRYADLQTKQYAGRADAADGYSQWVSGTTYDATNAASGAAFKLKTMSVKYDISKTLTAAAFHQTAESDSLIRHNTSTASAAGNTTKFDRKTTGLAGSFQATPTLKLMVNRQQVKIGDENNAGTDGAKTTVTGLGADYSLSKRTTLYVRHESNDDKAGVRSISGYSAVSGNTDYKATAVGFRHTF